MGSGKTSALINHINSAPGEKKFLYIAPYLNEVNRIIEECSQKNFKQPQKLGSKLNGIKHLFKKGENIVSTHALFGLFDEEIIELACNNHYTLIVDEVAHVVDNYDISNDDLNTVLEKYARIDDEHKFIWYATKYKGILDPFKKLCNLGCMGSYNNNAIWMFPISTFKAFKEVYILTYMFDAQYHKYYYDYYGIKCDYLNVKKDNKGQYVLTSEKVVYKLPDYKKLIHILDNKKLNKIGDSYYDLSEHWYKKNMNDHSMKKLSNNCSNFYKNYAKTPSNLNMWTTFKDYKNKVSGKGYAKGHTPCNLRATNEYRNKESVAYLINVFYNPNIKNFFTSNGIKVDEDKYALSEMLQWLFRTRIREGKPINLYIPSKRMRDLLINWLDSFDKDNKEGEIITKKKLPAQRLSIRALKSTPFKKVI